MVNNTSASIQYILYIVTYLYSMQCYVRNFAKCGAGYWQSKDIPDFKWVTKIISIAFGIRNLLMWRGCGNLSLGIDYLFYSRIICAT